MYAKKDLPVHLFGGGTMSNKHGSAQLYKKENEEGRTYRN